MTIYELTTLCRLARAPGLDGHTLRRALEAVGSCDALLACDALTLARVGCRPATIQALLRGVTEERLEADLAAIEQGGWTVLAAHDPRYPAALLEIAKPPAVLFVAGDPAVLARPQLAIVGSRHPTANGRITARDFACHFASLGLVITSGLALGIDAASHGGALSARGGLTIAVCGTGLDLCYPPANRSLAERIIAAGGALLSEFPPGTPPWPAHFPQRNRLISGLALGVLVVEAAARSGSLATARCAGEQGREVFAVPGSIHSPQSRGCHALLRQGAVLVECAEDVLTELKIDQLNQLVKNPSDLSIGPPDEAARLHNPGEILLDALGFEPTGLDALIASTGLSSSSVASLLLALELEGRVASDSAGRYFRLAGLPEPGAERTDS